MPSPTPDARRSRAPRPGLATALVTLLAATACGGTDPEPADSSAAPLSPEQEGRMPGVNGLVAATSGTTAQVQSATKQTTVTYTDSTTFTETVAASAADIAVGSCVVVMGADAEPDADQIAASRVAVSQPVDGQCGPAAGGPGGAFAGDPDGARRLDGPPPSRASDDLSPGAARDGDAPPGRMRGQAGGVVGTVTSGSGSGFVVTAVVPGAPAEPGSGETRTVTVTTDSSTTWTASVAATAAAVRVGVCLSAQGEADSTGAVAATAIAVRPAVDGECGIDRVEVQGGSDG